MESRDGSGYTGGGVRHDPFRFPAEGGYRILRTVGAKDSDPDAAEQHP